MPIHDLEIYGFGPGDGQPGSFTLPGSGIAVPAGLEATFEYNGLFLNVQQNADRYRVSSMDGLYDADIRDARDPNTNDDGETPYNSFYGGRTIVIGGTIQTYSISKLRDMQQALRFAFADVKTERPLHFRTGDFNKDHFINCKKIAPITGIEQQSNLNASRDFQISLRASNPRFLSYYENFIDAYPHVPTLTSSQIAVVTNAGNYSAQPVWRIYGPCSSSTITIDETGDSFTIGAITFADFLEFNIEKKTLKNSTGINSWNLLADDSDYARLISGDNHIFYEGDSPRVSISWRDSWI